MLHNNRLPGKWLIVAVGVALALGGCGEVAPPAEPSLEPTVAPSFERTLVFWVTLNDRRYEYFREQLDGWNVDITNFSDRDQMEIEVQNGNLPDFAALSFRQVRSFQEQLIPVSELLAVNSDDFLPDAIGTNTFDGKLYGLPWLRYGCSYGFENLAAFAANDKEPGWREAVAKVLDFLTAPEQQAANYNDLFADSLEFYPTRQAVYDEVNPVQICSFAAGDTPLTPELLAGLIDAAGAAQSELGEVLGDKTLNPYAGAFVTGEAGFDVIALPFSQPFGATEQAALDAGSPIFIGAMLVEKGNALKLPSGHYAIQCHPDGPWCEGLVADGGSTGKLPLLAEKVGFEAVPPFAWYDPAEAGMFLMLIPGQQMGADPICIAFDSFRWCFG